MTAARFLKTGIIALLCLCTLTAHASESRKQQQPASGTSPLAAAAIRELESRPEYRGLKARYEDRRQRQGAAWVKSADGRKMLATLKRLHTEAASTTTIDPDAPNGRPVLNYTTAEGRVAKLINVFQRQNESDESFRKTAAQFVGLSITDRALADGLIPYDLSPRVNEAMSSGYAAANQGDYLAAIAHFQQAHDLAPDAGEIFYNLALAEAMLPGRELRAVVWFGAFVAADPKTPKAPAIEEKVRELKARGATRFLKMTQEMVEQIPSQNLKDIYLSEIVELWARAGEFPLALQTIETIHATYERNKGLAYLAGAQARRGDFGAGLASLAGIADAAARSSGQRFIADARLDAGDIAGAIKTVEGIPDPYEKCMGMRNIAEAQREAGNPAIALRTLAAALPLTQQLPEPPLRSVVQQYLAVSQATAGDPGSALQTADRITAPFSISLAKQLIAEIQARRGDLVGARQTLAAAFAAADQVKDTGSRAIIMQAHAESKARIDAGKANDPAEQPRRAPPPSVKPREWVTLNASILDAPVFVDLAKFLKTLPANDPAKILGPLSATAKKVIEAHEEVDRMLKQQAVERARSNAGGA